MNNLKIVSICFLLFLSACLNNTKKEEEGKNDQSKDNPYAKAVIDIKTFQTDTTGWGYDIYIHKDLYIHQKYIPAINGNKGFKSETDANKVAEFVAGKIRNNIIPPTVKTGELDSLGILYEHYNIK